MLDGLFKTFLAGVLFYFGWKVGQSIYPHIKEAFQEGWEDARKDNRTE